MTMKKLSTVDSIIPRGLLALLAGIFISVVAACSGGSSTTETTADGGAGGGGEAGAGGGGEAGAATKTRFVEPNVSIEDTADWDGSPIAITSEGVAVSVNGGVIINADASATRVKAVARILAMANASDKTAADQTITEVKSTFTITRSGGAITIACAHGGTNGTAVAALSGCEQIVVTIPTGSTQKLVSLTADTVPAIDLKMSSAVIKSIRATSGSDVNAQLPATKGGSVTVVSKAGSIDATLPSGWAADEVILEADADKITAPSDVKSGSPHGAVGTGLASLKLTSQPFAGSTGTLTLK